MVQKPITCPPECRCRLTLPEPWTFRRLIQRPPERSNLKGLNHTLSPCGTQGISSTFIARSGSAQSSVKDLNLSSIIARPPCLPASRKTRRLPLEHLLTILFSPVEGVNNASPGCGERPARAGG